MLILDEPTNHLDIESREALEDALRSFTGAILLVSHDRALLDAVGTRTVAVEDGSLHSYVGGWPEYVRVRDEWRAGAAGARVASPAQPARRAGTATPPSPPATANGSHAQTVDGHVDADALTATKPRPKPKGPSKNRLSEQQKAERAIEAAEAALKALEAELADPAAWATRYEAAKSEARHTARDAGGRGRVRAAGDAGRLKPLHEPRAELPSLR